MSQNNLNSLIERERRRDFLRSAASHRQPDVGTPVTRVTLRWAGAGDRDRLRDLTAPEQAPPLAGAALVAEVDGRVRAALPLDGSPPVADHQGSDLVELLRLRAAQLARS